MQNGPANSASSHVLDDDAVEHDIRTLTSISTMGPVETRWHAIEVVATIVPERDQGSAGNAPPSAPDMSGVCSLLKTLLRQEQVSQMEPIPNAKTGSTPTCPKCSDRASYIRITSNCVSSFIESILHLSTL